MKKIKSWKELNKIEKRKVIISNSVLIILLIIVGISFVFYNNNYPYIIDNNLEKFIPIK